MRLTIATVLLLLTFIPLVQAQTPEWEAELGEDLVEMRGDKMVIEDYALVKMSVQGQETNNLQVKLSAEAPKDGIISRDNFVNLTSMITYMSLLEIYAQAYQLSASEYFQAVDIEQIPNPIGTPDIELNLTATNAGLQIEFVSTADNQRRRVTQTWEEMYAD